MVASRALEEIEHERKTRYGVLPRNPSSFLATMMAMTPKPEPPTATESSFGSVWSPLLSRARPLDGCTPSQKIKECPPLREINQLRVRQRPFLAGDDAAYLIGCHRRRILLVLGARHAKLESAVAREWMRYSHSVTFSDGEAACFARICFSVGSQKRLSPFSGSKHKAGKGP